MSNSHSENHSSSPIDGGESQQILLILVDESLSMRAKKFEVLNGINQFLDVQREVNPDSRLILIKFNSQVTVLHSGTSISEVGQIRAYEYNPGGKTALFDAIQTGIELTERLKREQDRVVCIVITDGEDTASSKQNSSTKTIKKLVKKYDYKSDWSFTYIGRAYENWRRTKSVSTVSYTSNAQRSVCPRHKPIPAAIRRHKMTQSSSLVCQN